MDTCKLQCLSELLPGDQILGYGSLDHEVSSSGDLGHAVIRVIWCHHPDSVIRGHPLRNTWHAGCCVTNIHMNTIIDFSAGPGLEVESHKPWQLFTKYATLAPPPPAHLDTAESMTTLTVNTTIIYDDPKIQSNMILSRREMIQKDLSMLTLIFCLTHFPVWS